MKLRWLCIWLLLIPWMGNTLDASAAADDNTQWDQLLQSPAKGDHPARILAFAQRFSEFDPLLSNEMIDLVLKQPSVPENDSLIIQGHMLKANNFDRIGDLNQSDLELKQALRLAEKIKSNYLQTKSLYRMALLQMKQENYQKALLYFKSAEKLLIYPSQNVVAVNIFLGQAEARMGINEPEKSQWAIDTAFHLAEALNNRNLVAECYLKYADLAKLQSDLPAWQGYLNRAFQTLETEKPSPIKKTILNDLSRWAQAVGDTLSAIDYMIRAEEMGQFLAAQQLADFKRGYNSIIDFQPNKKQVGVFWYLVVAILMTMLLVLLYYWGKKLRKSKSLLIENQHHADEKAESLRKQITDFDEAVKQELDLAHQKGEEEIRERKANYPKLEEALEFSKQTDYLKDMFLAKLSHEVRSPLTTILGFSSLLETELAMMESPELFDYASTITQSGQSLIDLLNNIFDLSLINSNNLELKISSFNFEKLTTELIQKFEGISTQKGIRIVAPDGNIGQIESDKGLVERILTMILDNSVRFTEKGYIKIDAQINDQKTHATIQIKDTGVGIDKTYLNDVFEPYRKEKLGYSTLYQGAGLSLPLAKKMVTILGGSIKIESEKGNGTTVFIRLPLVYSSNSNTENEFFKTTQPEKSGSLDNHRILVIEPDQLTRLLIEKFLKKNYTVFAVANKGHGKSLIADELKENRLFDLIILNIPPTDNKSTAGFIADIKKSPGYGKVELVALTSQPRTDGIETFIKDGFLSVIHKPIMRDNLEAAINQALQQKK